MPADIEIGTTHDLKSGPPAQPMVLISPYKRLAAVVPVGILIFQLCAAGENRVNGSVRMS